MMGDQGKAAEEGGGPPADADVPAHAVQVPMPNMLAPQMHAAAASVHMQQLQLHQQHLQEQQMQLHQFWHEQMVDIEKVGKQRFTCTRTFTYVINL